MSLPAPVTYNLVSGSLPPGITLTASGLMSGVPSIPGSYNFMVRATGADTTYVQRAYSMAVVEISPALLPDGSTGTPYAAALSVTGMASPTWGLIGSLPDGVTLNPSTGVLAGTPAIGGTYPFGITATEGDIECQQSYSIEITGACIDWESLLWALPVASGASGPPFDGYTFQPPTGDSDPAFTATTFNAIAPTFTFFRSAQVAFDSPVDCNCNLHLDVSTLLNASTRVRVTRDDIIGPGSILLDTTFLAAEIVADYPFTVPAGTYNVVVNLDITQDGFGSLVEQGTFTNV